MFVQRKYERDNDTQAYLQRKIERDNATQAYLHRKGERENAGYGNVTLAMVTVTFDFLWNRSPALHNVRNFVPKKRTVAKNKHHIRKEHSPKLWGIPGNSLILSRKIITMKPG